MSADSSGFGGHVRGLRTAAGLTQAELAEASGISERTVSDLERGLRTSVYPTTARRLASALAVPQEGMAAFLTSAQDARGTDLSFVAELPGIRSSLPGRLTPLIGREREMAALVGILRDPSVRLVTLVGPGGIGKTRLAVEAAAAVEPDFPGGTFFVNLSTVDDSGAILSTVALAVGVVPGTADTLSVLAGRLGGVPTLVVLDTCEHLLAGAVGIANLINECPELTILATSRASLRVGGEHELPVEQLGLGDPGAVGPAGALFLERARSVAPHVVIDEATVSQICARLDGLPLAIELAAARVKHMPPVTLLHHLEQRMESLVGGNRDAPLRHRTMRAAVDWSYVLLGPDEMSLFRRLSVFRGGFGVEHAAALGETTDVMPALSALIDASVVVREQNELGEARYRLLDVVRDYALERASAAGETDLVKRLHAEFFVALAERAEPELRGGEQLYWFERLRDDDGNFRAAITWCLDEGDAEGALRLAGELWMFWRWAGRFVEGRALIEAALGAAGEVSVRVRGQALWGAGWLAFHQGDYPRTAAFGDDLGALAERTGDPIQRRNGLTLTGNAALAQGRAEEAVALLRAALDCCQGREGASWYEATSNLNLGTAILSCRRSGEACRHFEKALAIYRDLGDRHFTARTLLQLGYAHLSSGNVLEAIETSIELGDGWGIAEGLEAAATLLVERQPETAVKTAGAAERLREAIAMRPHPPDAEINREGMAVAAATLGRQAYDEAWAEGRSLEMQEIIATVTSKLRGPAPG